MTAKVEKGSGLPPEETYRILILNDNAKHANVIKTVCKDAGHEVVSVSTVDESMDFLETKDHVDVIVSEGFLETDNVFELLKLLKRNPLLKAVPVLILAIEPSQIGWSCLSSLEQTADILGAYKVVCMPSFDSRSLMSEIREILKMSGVPRKERTGDDGSLSR